MTKSNLDGLNEFLLGICFSFLSLWVLVSLFFSPRSFAASAVKEVPQTPVFESGRSRGVMSAAEIIVKMKEGPNLPSTLSDAERSRFDLQSSPRTTSGGELIYELTPESIQQLDTGQAIRKRILEIVKELNALPNVEYAQANWLFQPMGQ